MTQPSSRAAVTNGPHVGGLPRPAPLEESISSAREVVFIADVTSTIEMDILGEWIERNNPPTGSEHRIVRLDQTGTPRDSPKRGHPVTPRTKDVALADFLNSCDDPILAPLRVLWLAPEHDGSRGVRLRDLIALSDPRDPGRLRQYYTVRFHPDRFRVIAGATASVAELRKRWKQDLDSAKHADESFASFVARRAVRSLERSERDVIGLRYKVPKLVREEILGSRRWRAGAANLAKRLSRPESSVMAEASGDLAEIAAGHSRVAIDIQEDLSRWLYRGAYGERPKYDATNLDRIAELGRKHPIVFLPSHRSYIDTFFLRAALHDYGLPPNHIAAGANLDFFPISLLLRRAGFFFIRRSFKDDSVYKFVLDEYISYLIGKRFPIEWYIEGGRSRQGKLLPPRFGLLNNVVDAYLRGSADDIYVVPVSIIYDQMNEVVSYAAEAAGAKKHREGIGWMVKYARSFFQGSFGSANVRFGEPLSMREALGAAPALAGETHSDRHLDIQKLAFEVMVRINAATPVTPTSLVTMALLLRGDRALTPSQLVTRIHDLLVFVERRNIPTTGPLDLDNPDGVTNTLEALMDHDVVTCFSGGPDTVYEIGAHQHIEAAYYRNTIIHFFTTSAIAEVALLTAASTQSGDRLDAFWCDTLELRDLLKFEFFFDNKERYRADVAAEMMLRNENWEAILAQDEAETHHLLQQFQPLMSPTVLRSFVEAYQVVADTLVRIGPNVGDDEAAILDSSLALGRQYLLQAKIKSAESESIVLFKNALKLARNRGLFDSDRTDLVDARRRFADELHEVVHRIDAVDVLAAAQHSGFLD